MKIKSQKCAICRNELFRYYYKGRDRFYGVEGFFDIIRCDSCGLLSIVPIPSPETLKKHYPSNYYSYNDTERISPRLNSLKEKLRFYLSHPIKALNCIVYSKLLKQKDLLVYSKGANVLDIGCGDGRYLLGKSQQGCSCFGIDIDSAALKRLQEKDSSVKVFCGDIWDANFKEETFDIVNLDNVFEHITEPERLLDEVKSVMAKDGLLRLVVPNSSSLTHKIFRSRWMGLDVPRHIYTYSIGNLKRLFKKKGFAIKSVRTIENSFDFLGSIIYLINDIFKTDYKVMDCDNIWDNEFLKFLFSPYAFLVNGFKIGDSVEVILQSNGKGKCYNGRSKPT